MVFNEVVFAARSSLKSHWFEMLLVEKLVNTNSFGKPVVVRLALKEAFADLVTITVLVAMLEPLALETIRLII